MVPAMQTTMAMPTTTHTAMTTAMAMVMAMARAMAMAMAMVMVMVMVMVMAMVMATVMATVMVATRMAMQMPIQKANRIVLPTQRTHRHRRSAMKVKQARRQSSILGSSMHRRQQHARCACRLSFLATRRCTYLCVCCASCTHVSRHSSMCISKTSAVFRRQR